jgi:TolB protein
VLAAAGGAAGPSERPGLVVFDSSDGLHTIRSNGTDLRRLAGTDPADADPRWSPNGKRIAFWSGESDGGSTGLLEHVLVANPNGSDRRTLAVGEYPVWSPNGKLIAFDSDTGGEWQIYVMNANGTNVRHVPTGRFAGYYPSFVTNARLSFDAGDPNVAANANYTAEGIWVVNLNGSGLEKLETISPGDANGDWSPDGKTLAYTTYVHGRGEIALAGLEGGVQRRLTSNNVDDRDPAWTPDGRRLVFTSARSGEDEVYSMKADGTDVKRITFMAASYAEEGDWRP